MKSRILNRRVKKYLDTKPNASQIINSTKWDLYIKGMEEGTGEGNAYLIFETHVQEIYKKILKQYQQYNDFPRARNIDLPQSYKPKPIGATSFAKLDDTLLRLIQAHALYTDILHEVTSRMDHIKRLYDKQTQQNSDSTSYYATLNSTHISSRLSIMLIDFDMELRKRLDKLRTHQALFLQDNSHKKSLPYDFADAYDIYAYARDRPRYRSRIEPKFYKYYAKNINELQHNDTEVAKIIDIVYQLKKGNNPTTKKHISLTKPSYEPHYPTPDIALKLTQPETKTLYENIITEIETLKLNQNYMTVEQIHTIETLENNILPDGLTGIVAAHQAKSANTFDTEVKYVEILTLSANKTAQILGEVQQKIEKENDQYYKSTIDILTKT